MEDKFVYTLKLILSSCLIKNCLILNVLVFNEINSKFQNICVDILYEC